mmetsp:Transcript_38563/g.75341  ORF Transcript_38563/g.75341 Transcript_38563/m.75341 type:complete len:201 (-) Transcript_38563:83-685(-)
MLSKACRSRRKLSMPSLSCLLKASASLNLRSDLSSLFSSTLICFCVLRLFSRITLDPPSFLRCSSTAALSSLMPASRFSIFVFSPSIFRVKDSADSCSFAIFAEFEVVESGAKSLLPACDVRRLALPSRSRSFRRASLSFFSLSIVAFCFLMIFPLSLSPPLAWYLLCSSASSLSRSAAFPVAIFPTNSPPLVFCSGQPP